jgi:hypothetical protein
LVNIPVNEGMKRLILFFILLSTFLLCRGQENNNRWEVGGYISAMQSTMLEKWNSNWLTEELLHNRLNFKWYVSNHFTAGLEVRTRLIFGEFVRDIPGYAMMIDPNQSWSDLSGFLVKKKSLLLHSAIDRLWLDYSAGSLQLRLGRQRINWGQNFAWNPNDIFNTYSFFDFDYAEKPGSDAVDIQYFTGASSLLETAIKIDTLNNITAATKYRFSKWNYDFQFIGGILNSEDWVLGTGWAGDIGGAGFRGELSYFHPMKSFADTSGCLIASLGIDYTFKNSLMLQGEVLYSGAANSISSFQQYYYMPLSVKTISFTDWSLLTKISYPFTPLFQGGLSLMVFPSMKGYFISPDLEYSIATNLTASFIVQHFNAEFTKRKRQKISLCFLRVKFSF